VQKLGKNKFLFEYFSEITVLFLELRIPDFTAFNANIARLFKSKTQMSNTSQAFHQTV